MGEYEYNLDSKGTVTDLKSAEEDGWEKEDDVFTRRIELEDSILVESRPIIKTTVTVYATGHWTDGKECELRIDVPIEFVAGFEEDVVEEIKAKAIASLLVDGTGLERLDMDNINFEQIKLPEQDSELSFEEKPVFRRKLEEGEIKETERAPNSAEVLGRQVTRGTKSILGFGARAVGGALSFLGNAIGKVGGWLKRF